MPQFQKNNTEPDNSQVNARILQIINLRPIRNIKRRYKKIQSNSLQTKVTNKFYRVTNLNTGVSKQIQIK